MTLDSLPDLDTSGLCLVKTLSTALTCWPYRNMALRDGARTSTRTSSVAKGRTASIHTSRACKARWRSRGSDEYQPSAGGKSPSRMIDERIKELGDWRGQMLSQLRTLMKHGAPEGVEEWQWRGVSVRSARISKETDRSFPRLW